MHVIGLLLVAQQAVAPGQEYPGEGSPEVALPRIESSVVIDGRLDEAPWEQAARLTDFWQYQPADGRRAAEETEVLVWYAPDAIHFGIRAQYDDPDRIRASVSDRDNIGDDDRVTIYLDTFDDNRRAFFFAVNALGIQQDGVRSEGASGAGSLFGGNTDLSPDYAYDSSGRLTDTGYVVEVRVPFKSLRYPSGEPQRWGLQIERLNQRSGYTDTWTDTRRASSSFLAQSGTLVGLRELERGIVFETQPFVTASARGIREGTGEFERESIDTDGGANFHVGLSNFSLDAAVNPDFSQVEADAGQVTINERFSLFFPEKRPFFLEGIELFSTPNQLVYTRQIGNPSVGGKFTGKAGRIGIAHLTALDDPRTIENDALFNISRLRADFAGNSVAGITYTDRSVVRGSGYNRVLAADVHHVFGGMYYIEAQLGGAWTRDAGSSHDASIWKLELDRTGRSWGFVYTIDGIGNDFVTRSGYVPRNGIINARAFNRLTLYGDEGELVENFTVFFGPTRIWRNGDLGEGDAIEGREQVNASLDLRGGWNLSLAGQRQFFVLDPADYSGYRVGAAGPTYLPLDEVSGPDAELTVRTPAYRYLRASATAGYGRAPIFPEGAEGSVTSASGDIALRPTGSIRVDLSVAYQRLDRVRDDSRFARTVIPRARIELQPTRALQFRGIAEYRSERRAALVDARGGDPLFIEGSPVEPTRLDGLQLDLLASFEPTPGTIAFLGYGSALNADESFSFSRFERRADGFFLKFAYRFRR